MKKRFNTQRRALAAATLLGLGCIHLHANAQLVANSAVIELDGKLTGPTCILIAGASGAASGFTAASNQKIDLGSGNLSLASNSSGIGSALAAGTWQEKTINFSLSTDGKGLTTNNACDFTTSGAASWDIQLAVDPALILTNGQKTYLKNAKSGSSGGTDAVVALRGGFGSTPTTDLTLNSTGTYLSSGGANGLFSATATGTTGIISLSAQLVNGKATGKPTAGQYLTPITLAVQYK
jgi:hypothetical protein